MPCSTCQCLVPPPPDRAVKVGLFFDAHRRATVTLTIGSCAVMAIALLVNMIQPHPWLRLAGIAAAILAMALSFALVFLAAQGAEYRRVCALNAWLAALHACDDPPPPPERRLPRRGRRKIDYSGSAKKSSESSVQMLPPGT